MCPGLLVAVEFLNKNLQKIEKCSIAPMASQTVSSEDNEEEIKQKEQEAVRLILGGLSKKPALFKCGLQYPTGSAPYRHVSYLVKRARQAKERKKINDVKIKEAKLRDYRLETHEAMQAREAAFVQRDEAVKR